MEPWDRPEGNANPGHGITAVLEGGTVLEKVCYCCHIISAWLVQCHHSSHLFCSGICALLCTIFRISKQAFVRLMTPGITRRGKYLSPSGICLQAAVSTTFVQGILTAQRAKAMSSRGRSIDQEGGQRYTAAALSLVFHPAQPLVPTLRADVRRFEVTRYPCDGLTEV